MFLKVAERDRIDLLNLRGTPAMFYYVILALTAAAFALRLGFCAAAPAITGKRSGKMKTRRKRSASIRFAGKCSLSSSAPP